MSQADIFGFITLSPSQRRRRRQQQQQTTNPILPYA
jgi:hypothetical protein